MWNYIPDLLCIQEKLAKTQLENELKFMKVDVSLAVRSNLVVELLLGAVG
jgi:hypothetical protein